MNEFENILKGDLNTLILELNEAELKSVLKSENDAKKFNAKKREILNKAYKNLFQYDYLYNYNDGRMNILNLVIPCSIRSNKENKIGLYIGKMEILITLCHILNIDVANIFKATQEETFQAFIEEVRALKNRVINANTLEDLKDLKIISEELYDQIKNEHSMSLIFKSNIEMLKSNRKTLLVAIIRDTKELIKREDIEITDDIIKYIDIEKLGLWISGTIIKYISKFGKEKELKFHYFNNRELITDEEHNNLIKYVIEYYKYINNSEKYKNNYKKQVNLVSESLNDKKSLYTTDDFKKDYASFYKQYLFENKNPDNDIISKMSEIPPKDFFVGWEILPQGNNNIKKQEEKQKAYKNIRTIGGLKASKDEIDIQKQKLLEDKIAFFSNTNPILKIKGTNKMLGYYGYVYRNGNVIFEKYYKDEEYYTPTDNEAIYVMNIDNFMELSKLSKSEIMEYIKTDSSKVKRIYHSKTWKERVIHTINEKTTVTKDNITEMFAKLSKQNNTKGLKELREILMTTQKDSSISTQKVKK